MRYAYQAYLFLQHFEFMSFCRLDKAFTPHPAWKTRTLLSIWGQQMLA